jgi:hypothetical protein
MGRPRKRPATAPKRPRKTPDKLTREEYARTALRDVHADLRDARENGPKSNIPLLLREARSAREELDTILAEEERGVGGDPFEALTDEELVSEALSALRDMPDHLVEPLAEELVTLLGRQWFERYLSKTALRVVPGGG